MKTPPGAGWCSGVKQAQRQQLASEQGLREMPRVPNRVVFIAQLSVRVQEVE